MNLIKANYHAISMFGNEYDFKEKLKIEGENIYNVIDTRDRDGKSLLETAIAYHNFPLAKFFLGEGAKVNIITEEGRNEFHYIAAYLHVSEALEVAKILLDRKTDLSLQDKKYGNTAMLTLCIEAFKKRTPEVDSFLCECLSKYKGINEENKNGYNVRKIIEEKGSEAMKKILKI